MLDFFTSKGFVLALKIGAAIVGIGTAAHQTADAAKYRKENFPKKEAQK